MDHQDLGQPTVSPIQAREAPPEEELQDRKYIPDHIFVNL